MSGKNTGNSGVDSGFPTSSLSSCGVEHSVDTTQEDPQSQVTDEADDIDSPASSLSLSSLDTSDVNSANRANNQQSGQQSVADISTSLLPADNQGSEKGSVQFILQPLCETVPALGHAAAGAEAGYISAPPRLGLQSENETLDKQFSDAGFVRKGKWYRCDSCTLRIHIQDPDIPRIEVWTLHARRSPGCEFLKKTKGPGFIKECRVDPAKKPVTENEDERLAKSEFFGRQKDEQIQAFQGQVYEWMRNCDAHQVALYLKMTNMRAQVGTIEAKQDDFAAKQDDFAAKQDDIVASQDHFAAKQDDFAAKQDDFAAKQDHFASKQDDFAVNVNSMIRNQAEANAGANAGANAETNAEANNTSPSTPPPTYNQVMDREPASYIS